MNKCLSKADVHIHTTAKVATAWGGCLPSVPHCVGVDTLLRAGVERRDGGDLVGG
jgi:hypothetical protein